MTEARIGRLVAACLHQAIADELPQRLDFYDHWLKSETLRDRAIGQAPLAAVIGFLRTEGADHDRVMARAGTLAAEWTVASMSPFRRRVIGWLPRALRARSAMRIVRGLVRDACSTSRAATRVRGRSATLEVTDSLFCASREASSAPLCAFYLAAATGVLRAIGFPSQGRLDGCRAAGRPSCVVTLALAEPAVTAPDPAIAA
jgi:hypothetical protein